MERTAGQTEWLEPTYMSGNPGWLKPLQRLMQNQHQLTMLNLLPRGLAVEVTPFPVGIRGSFHEPCWLKILDRIGIRLIAS